MTSLHNKKGKEQLLQDLAKENFERQTISFYRYVELNEVQQLRDELFAEWSNLKVLGRVYVSKEGINAQISVPTPNLEIFRSKLEAHSEFQDMPFKLAVEEGTSFIKLTIKVRKEIVAYQVPEDEYDMSVIGQHLSADEFNQAIDDGAIVLDMRNQYEAEVGKFETAIVPDVDRSQDLLAEARRLLQGHEDDKVLIYCTGGIRCEKASSYLMHHGFKNVNQLKGGIIQYANDIKATNKQSKFIGKNFVFDHRMAERITDDVIGSCHQCHKKADHHTDCANEACHILFIQCDACAEQYDNCCSRECADFIKLPIEEQRRLRKSGKLNFTAQKSDRIKPRLNEVDNHESISSTQT